MCSVYMHALGCTDDLQSEEVSSMKWTSRHDLVSVVESLLAELTYCDMETQTAEETK